MPEKEPHTIYLKFYDVPAESKADIARIIASQDPKHSAQICAPSIPSLESVFIWSEVTESGEKTEQEYVAKRAEWSNVPKEKRGIAAEIEAIRVYYFLTGQK